MNNNIEKRMYTFRGRPEDLDKLEKLFRHIEYLGRVGASRNLLVRVDGDGSGRITVEKTYVDWKDVLNYQPIDKDKYNINQNNLNNGCVGIYDIG